MVGDRIEWQVSQFLSYMEPRFICMCVKRKKKKKGDSLEVKRGPWEDVVGIRGDGWSQNEQSTKSINFVCVCVCVSAIKKPTIFQDKHKLFNFIFTYGYVPMYVCVWVFPSECGWLWKPEESTGCRGVGASSGCELFNSVDVGVNIWSSTRTANAFTCRTSSPDPKSIN